MEFNCPRFKRFMGKVKHIPRIIERIDCARKEQHYVNKETPVF